MSQAHAVVVGGRVGRLIRRWDDGRGVSASALTSLLVRASTIVTAVAAVPVALHSLGDARFATFLVLYGFINWLNLGGFGMQSALGRLIAAKHEPGAESRLLGAALVFATVTSLIAAALVSVALMFWTRAQGPGRSHELATASAVMVVMATLQVILQVFEGVQIGRLSLYKVNLTRLVGSAYTLVCLLTLPRVWPSIIAFIVAMNGGLLLSAILNAMLVLRRVRPSFEGLSRNIDQMRRVASSGAAFFLISIASVLQLHVPLLVLTQVSGPANAANFGVLTRLIFNQMVIVNAISAPLWPAMIRARTEGDAAWMKRALLVSGGIIAAISLAMFLGLALFGDVAVGLWVGRRVEWPMLFQVAFGLYCLVMASSNYWGNVLVGQGRERFVAGVVLPEGLLIALATAIGARIDGGTGAIVGMVLATSAVSLWILPLAALLRMRNERRAERTGELT